MSKKYIKQIMKRLQCSKEKKQEIEKQLFSDIMVEVENGEAEQDVIKRMGTPSEIAEEFNCSFSNEEKKKYKKDKLRKRIVTIVFSIVIVVLVVAGGVYWALPKTYPITESRIFEEEVIKEQAIKVLQIVDAEDDEALKQVSSEIMQNYLKDEKIGSIKDLISSDWGEFQSYGNIYVVELRQMGQIAAVVQVTAAYENINVTFTLNFNQEMMLDGFWMG